MRELLIKNVNIVDWSQTFNGDVYIENGIIQEIGSSIDKDCKIIDGEGLTLLPSFIDMHTHFRDPGFTYKEDLETGSRAAVKGGFTVVNLMANTNPVCSTMKEVNYVVNKVKNINLIDAHQSISITREFNGQDISHLDHIDNKVKIISEDGKDIMNTKVLIDAMVKAKEKNLIVMCHCENHDISSKDMRLSENLMTWRNITLAQFTGCKTHIAHVSTKESMEYIIDSKSKGFDITCEVTPHHIFLTDKTSYKVNPPLRDKKDVDFLIDSIKKGYVDCIATDHAPHTKVDKEKGSPGISGIETAFPVCYTKLVKEKGISLNDLSKLMSKNPSKILNINMGEIKIGSRADLVLVDLTKKYKIKINEFESKGKNSPLDGVEVFGKVKMTFKEGNLVYRE